MAYYSINFNSNILRRTVEVQVLLPNDLREEEKKDNIHYARPMKTLVLLHGYSANSRTWMSGSNIEFLSEKYNLAIIMPDGGNSFYVDREGDSRIGTYVGTEVTAYIQKTFHLSKKREDTFIAGLSMGGFGAIRLALKYPEYYSKAAGMSAAFIIHNIKNQTEEYQDQIADYKYYRAIFGDLNKLEESDKNPETLIKKLASAGSEIPGMYITCGTEDFLINENRMFKAFLEQLEVPVIYRESTGEHDFDFWNKELEPMLRWMLEEDK